MSDSVVRFVETFEALRMAPTFARGRRDARAGHVRSLTISSSLVVAQVRGPEEPAAHRARIAIRAFGAAEWAWVEDDLASQARYVADLLAGRMPPGIEELFAAAGLHLLPLSLDEIAMDCTCERWPMPCTHLAATLYALARSFEADPFGVFAWRGRPRDELLDRLHQLRGAAAVEATMPPPDDDPSPGGDAGLGDIDDFWGSDDDWDSHPSQAGDITGGGGARGAETRGAEARGAEARGAEARGSDGTWVAAGSDAAGAVLRPDALLDQLDPPPLVVDGEPVVEILRPAYQALP